MGSVHIFSRFWEKYNKSIIVNVLLAHKQVTIGAIAVAGLVVYFLPIGEILSPVFAAK